MSDDAIILSVEITLPAVILPVVYRLPITLPVKLRLPAVMLPVLRLPLVMLPAADITPAVNMLPPVTLPANDGDEETPNTTEFALLDPVITMLLPGVRVKIPVAVLATRFTPLADTVLKLLLAAPLALIPVKNAPLPNKYPA